ncbi:hypothetical protein [Collimonas sp. OK307]|uniref:hypothetical protein n=1 Tax=Collimonas sp. OK307 TaxID=1801620 RepID=UPI001113FBAC|nr:hypothetical protein [Collimonas sp. OK307]
MLGKLAARQVIAEAIREQGAAPHVDSPKPPTLLFGMAAEDLALWWEQVEDMSKNVTVSTVKGERKQRSDTPILLGAVASYPGPADESDPLYVEWRGRTVAWLKDHYKGTLVTVMEHTDESYGHIHALCCDAGRSIKSLHAGFSAASKVEGKKEKSDAYKIAERALQDDYSKNVGVESGLARIGPKRRRLTRSAWRAEQQSNTSLALATTHARCVINDAETKAAEIIAAASAVELDREKVEQSRRNILMSQNRLIEASGMLRIKDDEIRKKAASVTAAGENRKQLENENRLLKKRIDALTSVVLAMQENLAPDDPVSPLKQMIFQKPK